MWTKVLERKCRYRIVSMKTLKRAVAMLLIMALLSACSSGSSNKKNAEAGSGADFVDVSDYIQQNGDVFAWVRIPETGIDYPVLQSQDGDDSFYKNHDYLKREDPKGSIFIEAANLSNMCDFNEVLHGSSPSDGTMFASLSRFLDEGFMEEHEYIYVYMPGNALVYYIFAAYTRDNTRLLEQYDFTYASGCQAYLDEIYSKGMGKVIRYGWENQVEPDNFIITLSTTDSLSGKQLVVVGCLVADIAGKIDRYVDYGDPDDY